MTEDETLRTPLVTMLQAGYAHLPFEKVVAGWPAEARGLRPAGANHSAWELVEHLRIAQWDILEFSQSAEHVSPAFPEGYWPTSPTPPDERAWEGSIEQFCRDLESMQALVLEPTRDLYQRIPHGDGQTILREAVVPYPIDSKPNADGSWQVRSRSEPRTDVLPSGVASDKEIAVNTHRPEGFGRNGIVFVVAPHSQ